MRAKRKFNDIYKEYQVLLMADGVMARIAAEDGGEGGERAA